MTNLSRFLFLLCCVTFSCEHSEVCPVGPGETYLYPEIPKEHSMSVEELNIFLDIPETVINCIPTQGLLESCLNYPFLTLIMAGSTPQIGYNLVNSQFRGLRELAIRPDRAELLLKKYQSIEPLGFDSVVAPSDKARYAFNIYFFEVILSQYDMLTGFSTEQKIELVNEARRIYQSKNKDNYVYGAFHMTSTLVILARLMKADSYPPFLDIQSQVWVENFVQGYEPTDIKNRELIYSLSDNYITFLKRNK